MAQFTANKVSRFDPYKNYKFKLKWDGQYVAGLSKMTPLKRTTEVVKHREGGDPSSSHKGIGRTEYDGITFSRGVTHDTAFEDWANLVFLHGAGPGAEARLKSMRKDIIVEIMNEAGTKVLAYNIYRAWVSEYVAVPEMDANANAVAIQSIKIEYEGFERDATVTEPTET